MTVREAKTHLSWLLRDVEAGEQVEIRRGQLTVAVLGPARQRARFLDLKGCFEGEFEVPDDFDDPHDDIARAFGTLD